MLLWTMAAVTNWKQSIMSKARFGQGRQRTEEVKKSGRSGNRQGGGGGEESR